MFNIEKKLHCAIKNYIGNSENFEKKKFFIWEKCEGVFVKKDKKNRGTGSRSFIRASILAFLQCIVVDYALRAKLSPMDRD